MTEVQGKQRRIQVSEKHLEVLVCEDGTRCTGQGSNRFGRFEILGELLPSNILRVKRIYLPALIKVVEEKRTSKRHSSSTSNNNSLECDAVVAQDATYLPEIQTLLQELRKKDKHAWFAHPVDSSLLGLERYYQVIDRPMDFATIQSKLDAKEYGSSLGLAVEDLRLVFSNAMRFNPKGTLVHRMASELSFHLETRVKYLSADKSKRVRVAKKFFQHVNELDNAELYRYATASTTTLSASKRKLSSKPVLALPEPLEPAAALPREEENGFESFDELDDLSDFDVDSKQAFVDAEGNGEDEFLTDNATPASGGELSPCPCFSPVLPFE